MPQNNFEKIYNSCIFKTNILKQDIMSLVKAMKLSTKYSMLGLALKQVLDYLNNQTKLKKNEMIFVLQV